MRRASAITMYIVVSTRTDAISAISVSISTHPAAKRQPSVASTPTANAVKMNERSAFIPSTATSIEPSRPRSALPLPHTVTNVTIATHRKLEQIDIVMKKCSIAFATILFGGRSISTNDVSVKPAITADCVATALKLVLKSLSSFSRRDGALLHVALQHQLVGGEHGCGVCG